MEIAIKSFNGIGDLLFVTPTLRRIKKAYPRARIVVNTNYPMLLEGNPFVDEIGKANTGVFLGYDDPIHCKWPSTHHILKDWEIVTSHYKLTTAPPDLQPELYLDGYPMGFRHNKGTGIGVQVIHKGHWHQKKVWPFFADLIKRREYNFVAIPRVRDAAALVRLISMFEVIVCSEGGLSHIAKALGVPAIVIYGGFAHPMWNGYEDHVNLCNMKWCSFCYNPRPCKEFPERLCMREISIDQVLNAVDEIKSR